MVNNAQAYVVCYLQICPLDEISQELSNLNRITLSEFVNHKCLPKRFLLLVPITKPIIKILGAEGAGLSKKQNVQAIGKRCYITEFLRNIHLHGIYLVKEGLFQEEWINSTTGGVWFLCLIQAQSQGNSTVQTGFSQVLSQSEDAFKSKELHRPQNRQHLRPKRMVN